MIQLHLFPQRERETETETETETERQTDRQTDRQRQIASEVTMLFIENQTMKRCLEYAH